MELSHAILRTASSTEDDWEVDPNHIFMKEKLGEGSFGEVYRGQLTSDVKCLRAKKYMEDMCSVSKTGGCSVAIKLLKGEEEDCIMCCDCCMRPCNKKKY